MATVAERESPGGGFGAIAHWIFVKVGPFPIMLVVLFIVFGLLSNEHRFWDGDNIFNMARQSTYLMIATMGQMLYLLSRNYDLSNGNTIAMTAHRHGPRDDLVRVGRQHGSDGSPSDASPGSPSAWASAS